MKFSEAKVAVLGVSGRMGVAISAILSNEGFDFTGITSKTPNVPEIIANSDVIIDFSSPQALVSILPHLKPGAVLVSGTTGLGLDLEKLQSAGLGARVIWSANMSFGVNVLAYFTQKFAGVLDAKYDIEILEKHHKHKKDAPSGTALFLGESAAAGRGVAFSDVKALDRMTREGKRIDGEIGFASQRGGEIIGFHEVSFIAPNERIWLGHEAFDRSIFASGAVKMAQIGFASIKENGFYGSLDVIKFLLDE